MVVTLGVSRLSGWLNALAFCAESKGNHEKEGGMYVLRKKVLGAVGHA